MTILLALVAIATAQCPTLPGWTVPMNVHAALSREMTFGLKTAKAYRLALAPAPSVRLAAQGRRIAKAGSWAGMAALDVTGRGTLSVVLSSATYIDLVRDGVVLTSVDHAMLAGCPGMHKRVTFDVVPGRYLVQLTDAPDQSVVFEATLGG